MAPTYLLGTKAGGDPGVLLQCTSGVIIGGGVPLEVIHQLGDGLLHLQRHGCHNILLQTERFGGHGDSCGGSRPEGEAERKMGVKRERAQAEQWGGVESHYYSAWYSGLYAEPADVDLLVVNTRCTWTVEKKTPNHTFLFFISTGKGHQRSRCSCKMHLRYIKQPN